MTNERRPVDHHDVEIERDGTRYADTYSVDAGIVTVYYRTASKKGTSREYSS
jgi:hypothetical protein